MLDGSPAQFERHYPKLKDNELLLPLEIKKTGVCRFSYMRSFAQEMVAALKLVDRFPFYEVVERVPKNALCEWVRGRVVALCRPDC